MHTIVAFAQKEGLHSPHSSLVSTLLEEGENEAGEEAGKRKRKKERKTSLMERTDEGYS